MGGNLSVTRTYDKIFTLSRDEIQDQLFDNVSLSTKMLFRMKELGAIVEIDGAPHLRFNIIKELPTTSGYTDLETITAIRPDPWTSVIFEWKQAHTPVEISGLDMIKTPDGGEPDLLAMMIEVAEISMREYLGGSSGGIFSDAGESTLTKLSGLQNHLGSSTTTGTVGGLSRATLAVWRHKSQNVSGAFDTNGLNMFRTLYRQCSRHDENVDTIVLTGEAMDNFERELTSSFQVNLPLTVGPGDQRMIDAGFSNFRYKNAIVFDDDGCPANNGYFLNIAKYLRFYVRRGRNAEIGDFVKTQDKDNLVTHVLTAGNLCITNLSRHGVLLNGDTF